MFEIDRNSLHYRLYETYGRGEDYYIRYYRYNFCEYARRVALGVLNVIIIVFFSVCAVLGLMQIFGTPIGWLVMGHEYVSFFRQDTLDLLGFVGYVATGSAVVEIMIVVILIVGSAFYWLGEYGFPSIGRKIRRGNNKLIEWMSTTNPGFIRQYYRAWKEKYCPIVKFKDETGS